MSAAAKKRNLFGRAMPRDLLGHLNLRRPRDKNAEAKAQAAIVEWVRWCAPHILILAIPNGGLRSKAEAARFKWTGVLAGTFDLLLVLPDGRCAFWECKAPTHGGLSDDQKIFARNLERLGHRWAIVRSIDHARRELAALGVETREHPALREAMLVKEA